MTHKIFISHNHNDKPIVEAVALRLANIFGQDQVFYDSWSIQPGDGIIDQMNRGLEAPEFVFFFVSAHSLASGMVSLEWQNALYAASKRKTRIVPVRVDGVEIPPILRQMLFIDMHSIGLEAAIAQIISVTQGNASFTPQHLGFSNLTFGTEFIDSAFIEITIYASHLTEPSPEFGFVTPNKEDDISWSIINQPAFIGGFHENEATANDIVMNIIIMRPITATLTPSHPLRFGFTKKGATKIQILGVFHHKGETEWVPVPGALPKQT
ncbi:toll/interleukin-1 receptor domain-containing protein [Xanthobacter sediminis]